MKTLIRILLPFLILSGSAACGNSTDSPAKPVLSAETEKARTEPFFDLEFHRGGRDDRAENTLYAYQYALENGAVTIECDMQMSRDGVLVMSHNSFLNPDITTDGKGNRVEPDRYFLSEMSAEEIQSFNVGHIEQTTEYYDLHGRTQVTVDAKIPTLREVFELVRDSGNPYTRLSIEVKTCPDPSMGVLYEKQKEFEPMIRSFDSLVREFGFEKRVLLQSFDWKALVFMKELNPAIETVALYSEQPSWGTGDSTTLWLDRTEPSPWLGGLNIHDFKDNPIRAAHSLSLDAVSPYYEEIDAAAVKEAHELGMKVIPWTVNRVEDMETLYEMGVDGVITDRPWILREYLISQGASLPEPMECATPYHLEPNHLEVEGGTAEGGRDAAY